MNELLKLYYVGVGQAIRREIKITSGLRKEWSVRNGKRRWPEKYYPDVGSWKCLGDGHFSVVYGSDKFPDVAIKISGKGGYGNAMPRCSPGMDDAYGIWAEFCLRHQGVSGIPTIHHIQKISESLVLYVLPRYRDRSYVGNDKFSKLHLFLSHMYNYDNHAIDVYSNYQELEDEHHWNLDWKPGEEAMFIDLCEMLSTENVRVDYHGGNFMADSEGRAVSTDPLCEA